MEATDKASSDLVNKKVFAKIKEQIFIDINLFFVLCAYLCYCFLNVKL